MATPKPRYGGVSNLDIHTKTPNTNMASEAHGSLEYQTDLRRWQGVEPSVIDREQPESSSHNLASDPEARNNPDVEASTSLGREGLEIPTSSARDIEVDNLLKVFDTLNIEASPLPYLPRDETREQNVLYCKNLFLKDRHNQFYFVTCLEEDSMDLKVLKQQLGAHRNLSFADAESLNKFLHILPGEVTPLALMHESSQDVKFGIHEKIVELSKKQPNIKFAFHPLRGDLQVNLTYINLVVFLEHFGKPFQILSEIKGPKNKKSVDNDKSKFKCLKEPEASCLRQPKSSSNGIWDHGKDLDCSVVSEHSKSTVKSLERTQSDAGTHNDDFVQPISEIKDVPCSPDLFDKSGEPAVPPETFELCLKGQQKRLSENFDEITGSCSVKETHNQFYKLQRKGKLSSYIRKNEKSEKTSNLSPGCKALDPSPSLDLTNEETQMEQFSSAEKLTFLPEIENFYSSLSDAGIRYKETDFSSNTGMNSIEPSIGCRCFLLKDRRDNFFFIISHELYELDFGRLKAALKPKKKLMVASPSEVIHALGTDPSKITPFSALTMRNPRPQTFFTSKVTSPKLVFCIQHPFAVGRRITIRSEQLQKYLDSLGISFGIVEEKYWPPRYERPFTQFETKDFQEKAQETNSKSSFEHLSMPPKLDGDVNQSEKVAPYDQTQRLAVFSHHILFSRLNATTITKTLAQIATYTVYAFPEYGLSPGMRSLAIFSEPNKERFHDGTGVDPVFEDRSHDFTSLNSTQFDHNLTHETEKSKHILGVNKKKTHESKQLLPQSLKTEEDAISLNIDKDLEHHLNRFGINFCIQPTQLLPNQNTLFKETDHTEPDLKNKIIDEDVIVEHCAFMHLLDKDNGQTFLIIAATDEFPISVRRFCRKLRLRSHLEIVSEPKKTHPDPDSNKGNYTNTAPNMLPFLLALSSGNKNTTRPTSSDSDTKGAVAHSCGTLLEQSPRSKVTVVLTTTLYIDPETVMEFTVGSEISPSRLRMTSSEFERYARAVGFDILYY